MDDHPKLKSRFITTSIGVPCDKEMKLKYKELKETHGYDMPGIARDLLRREILKIEKKIFKKVL